MPRNIMNLLGSTAIARTIEDDSGSAPAPTPTPEDAEAAAAAAAAAANPSEGATPPAETPKVSDDVAKLLKDVMKHKDAAKAAEARAKLFEGIDPEKARAALQAQADAERQALEARGEYNRIIEQVQAEKQAEVDAANAAAQELRDQLANIQRTVEEQSVQSQFAGSPFIRDNLVISGEKVRALYGSHFDTVDGVLVGYDKPRGAAERTPLVGADAKPLPFEAALEKVVKADPEWERLGKSKLKPGAGSGHSGINPSASAKPETGTDKIRAGLASLSRPSLNLSGLQTRR